MRKRVQRGLAAGRLTEHQRGLVDFFLYRSAAFFSLSSFDRERLGDDDQGLGFSIIIIPDTQFTFLIHRLPTSQFSQVIVPQVIVTGREPTECIIQFATQHSN